MRATILLICFIGGFLAQVGGLVLVVRDLQADARRAREIANRPAPTGYDIRDPSGRIVMTARGAMDIQQAKMMQDIAQFGDFVNDRLSGGQRARWTGVGLIILGAFLALAGDIVGSFAEMR